TAEPAWAELARRRRTRSAGLHGSGPGTVVSPMQGTVLEVDVAEGDQVTAGQIVCVVEAMKMENEIVAHRDGFVRKLAVARGEPVAPPDRRRVPPGSSSRRRCGSPGARGRGRREGAPASADTPAGAARARPPQKAAAGGRGGRALSRRARRDGARRPRPLRQV